jgi:hypothetical protein
VAHTICPNGNIDCVGESVLGAVLKIEKTSKSGTEKKIILEIAQNGGLSFGNGNVATKYDRLYCRT